MSESVIFKGWLQSFLLKLDSEIDTDIYLEYLFEILANYAPSSNNEAEVLDCVHSTLESLLPNVKITVSEEIFKEYSDSLTKNENALSNIAKSDSDILSEIIKKDHNAIDKNKRMAKVDPRYALDYVHDIDDGDENSFSESEIDAEFASIKLDRKMKIDDVIENISKDEAISATKMLINQKYNSEDESDDPDFDPLMNATGKSNREAIEKMNQENRLKLKEKSQQKKEKDKQDRVKQKDQQKSRKENEKKRTQKSERRR